MMRYQRVSPDYIPLSSNGRKPSGLRTTCKEDNETENGRIPNFSSSSSLRSRSNHSPESLHYDNHRPTTSHHETSTSNGVAGDVLLQWGHNKRMRGSRESRPTASAAAAAVTNGGGEAAGHSGQVIKIQRRAAAAAAAMILPPCGSFTRGTNLRQCSSGRDSSGPLLRSTEERNASQSRLEKRGPPSPPEKSHRMSPANGFAGTDATSTKTDTKHPTDQENGGVGNGCTPAAAAVTGEKLNLEQFEWPRIYISLSRKEKEDDFLAMKGTKLPQRPKKRAKNIDKTLQYCFPGMWLSDLTRGRYEVREKKCVKKQKRRGLKGMESMDSDSE